MTNNIPTLSKLVPFKPLKTFKIETDSYEGSVKLKDPYSFLNPNTLLGIEIEVENIENEFYLKKYWNCKEDNSLRNNGKEFITHPLRAKSIPYAIEYLKQVLYYNNDPIFSNRTSVHIHLNVRDFTIERLKVFLLLYCIFEKHFFNIAGGRRENNIFCIPLWKSEQPIHLNDWQYNLASWNKYNALNLGCILGNGINSNLGTVEFRHLYGTLDINILYPWINSIIHLREYSRIIHLDTLIDKLKTLNTTSEYISLYKKVFGITCLDLNLISKLDFESCISYTKLNYFVQNIYKPDIYKKRCYTNYNLSEESKTIPPPKPMVNLLYDEYLNNMLQSTQNIHLFSVTPTLNTETI